MISEQRVVLILFCYWQNSTYVNARISFNPQWIKLFVRIKRSTWCFSGLFNFALKHSCSPCLCHWLCLLLPQWQKQFWCYCHYHYLLFNCVYAFGRTKVCWAVLTVAEVCTVSALALRISLHWPNWQRKNLCQSEIKQCSFLRVIIGSLI